MSDLFSIYENNLNSIITQITKTIETFSSLSKDKSETVIQDSNNKIKEGDVLVIILLYFFP